MINACCADKAVIFIDLATEGQRQPLGWRTDRYSGVLYAHKTHPSDRKTRQAQSYRQPKGGADDGRAAKAAVHRLGIPNVVSALGRSVETTGQNCRSLSVHQCPV